MPTYEATQTPVVWSTFNRGILSGQIATTLRVGDTIVAAEAGAQQSTEDTVLVFGANRYTKAKFFEKISDTQPPPGTTLPPPPPPPTGDSEWWQLLQSTNPLSAAQRLGSAPNVVILSTGEGERVQLTRLWQLALVAWNPNMRLNNVAALLGTHKAFTNNTGFPTEEGETRRANWIMNDDLEYSNPAFDKVRSCALNCHKGIQVGSEVVLEIMNGNNPPPDVNPQSHPHLFFHATVIYKGGTIGAFPKAMPAWGYERPVVLLPLVSTYAIRVPLTMVRRVESYRLPYT